jgi:hypothetical protein
VFERAELGLERVNGAFLLGSQQFGRAAILGRPRLQDEILFVTNKMRRVKDAEAS